MNIWQRMAGNNTSYLFIMKHNKVSPKHWSPSW